MITQNCPVVDRQAPVTGSHQSEFIGYQSRYQTFADRPGFSNSPAKWATINRTLTDCDIEVVGRRALDIGCNQGYFCGALRECGAAFVCGMDSDEQSVVQARGRFPQCTFLHLNWDATWEGVLPELGRFDLALLVSALHYADYPEELVNKIHHALKPGGVLLLECGVADGPGERIRVERTNDTAWHFTKLGLRQLFANWTWRSQIPSVTQETDPMPRFLFALARPS